MGGHGRGCGIAVARLQGVQDAVSSPSALSSGLPDARATATWKATSRRIG